jgi:hypothetical protein
MLVLKFLYFMCNVDGIYIFAILVEGHVRHARDIKKKVNAI